MDPGPSVGLAAASRFWLRLGLVSFGGPAGQIAMLQRELVEERRWLSQRRFLHALNYCMVLPGPEATQLATYLGFLMHGTPGGLIAGGLFLLPSVVVLITLSSVYAFWGSLPLLASVFWALKPAVLAIVLQAAWRLGRRILKHLFLLLLALAAFVALVVLRVPYPLLLLLAALAGWAAGRWRPRWLTGGASEQAEALSSPPSPPQGGAPIHDDLTPTPAHARFRWQTLLRVLLAWGLALTLPLAGLVAWGGWQGSAAQMARFFTRVALISFGGAYAVLPYVAQGAVDRYGWLSADQMLDGLALGETTPGPLIMVVAFVGFMGGWNRGLSGSSGHWWDAVAAALVVMWFSFLPSFGFILAGAPLVEASRNDLRLGAPLTGITAALVGVIGSLAVLFAAPVLLPAGQPSLPGGLLLLLALLLQGRWGWGVLPLLGASALVGLGRAALLAL